MDNANPKPTMDDITAAEVRAARVLVTREARWRSLVMFLAVIVAFTCVVVIIQYRQGRVQRDHLVQISSENADVLKEVQSCTLPTGDCYRRGNANRAAYVMYFQGVLESNRVICLHQIESAKQRGFELSEPCPPVPTPQTVP